MEKQPVLFIGHGSPMNCILVNDFTRALVNWGERLSRPEAILVISAHWLTNGTFVTAMDKPRTIHDFYGFPRELYTLQYPAPGSAQLARTLAGSITATKVGSDHDWGLDHGAWAVLRQLFPAADIPVCQLSLDYSFNDWHPKPLRYHYDLARELAPLRRQGVLIIGSGNIVHNLAKIDFSDIVAPVYPWAEEFDALLAGILTSGNHHDLLHLAKLGENASLAVPTLDHYLPLIYTIALQEEGEPLNFIHTGFQHGSISMRSLQIG